MKYSINTYKHSYVYDQLGEEIYRDGELLSEGIAEPVFSDEDGRQAPQFSGIYLRETGEVISRAGNVNKVRDRNAVL